MNRTTLIVKTMVVALVAVIGAGTAVAATPLHPSHGTPVIRTAPTIAPPAVRHDGSCQVKGDQGTVNQDHGLVWIRNHPTGVVTVWVPNANTKRAHCATVRRVSDAKIAARLAAAIESAKRLPRGIFCPLDDGTSVRLYFTYANGHDEFINVELSGCHSVGAPGRAPRESSSAINRELKQIAPRRWAHYL